MGDPVTATRVRRGLPRTPGGSPWPDPGPDDLTMQSTDIPVQGSSTEPLVERPAAEPLRSDTAIEASAEPIPLSATHARRGLPRTHGGDPWPPATTAASSAAAAEPRESAVPTEQHADPTPDRRGTTPAIALRRGLPRRAGGEPWPPPAGIAPLASSPGSAPTVTEEPAPSFAAAVALETSVPREVPSTPVQAAAPQPAPSEPVRRTRTAAPAQSAPAPSRSAPSGRPFEPGAKKGGASRSPRQLAALTAVGVVAAAVVAAVLVLAARGLTTITPFRDFLDTFPGSYALPASAPVGIPAWLGWQHFLTGFLMVLIIRTGLQIRAEKRPPAAWTSRRTARKISITVWLHQSLDLLWFVNGVVFVVLLAATGQWMRIVPTSWSVFPNALSALQQYISLDWPTEDGWVNYNALQQLSYFAVVFLAAPAAAITGVRMSSVWPKQARRLDRLYPIGWARTVHFPVMIFFVVFIVIHVALVLATGALRNLNHMYGGQDAVNWVGFAVFVGSLVVIAAGWLVARPILVAPLASRFGTVSSR